MDRVRDARVSRRDGRRQRRGRPRVEWTPSRQRRLLRLYLCTPEANLPMDDILLLLKDEGFEPKTRKTQDLLKHLLSDSYRRRRPKNRECMKKRIQYLRYVRRCSEKRKKPSSSRQSLSVPAERGSISSNASASPSWHMDRSRPSISSETGSRHLSPMAEGGTPALEWGPFAPPPAPPPVSWSTHDSVNYITHHGSTERRFNPALINYSRQHLAPPHTSFYESEASNEEDLIPRGVSPASIGPSFDPRSSGSRDAGSTSRSSERPHSKLSFIRRRLTREHSKVSERSSSFFEDVASLFSSVSSRSSFLSTTSNSTNGRSSFLVDPPEIGALSESPHDVSPSSNDLDNQALIQFCCSGQNPLSTASLCVHKRITHAIMQNTNKGHSLSGLNITDTEVNTPDSLGNSLLHVVARWGAPLHIIEEVLDAANDVNVVNHRGQTFLHVLDSTAKSPFPPATFASFLEKLQSRKFNFRACDMQGRPFLVELVLKEAFPPEALEAAFHTLKREDLMFIAWCPDIRGSTLVDCITRKAHRLKAQKDWDLAYFCEYLVERHCIGDNSPATFSLPDLADARGRNILHQVIAAMNSNNEWPCKPIRPGEWVQNSSFKEALKSLAFNQDVNNKDSTNGRTPLMTLLLRIPASDTSDENIEYYIKCLIDAGATVNETDSRGNTALHYAAALGINPAVTVLADSGAEVDVANFHGYTPLDMLTAKLQKPKRPPRIEGMKVFARHLECAMTLVANNARFDGDRNSWTEEGNRVTQRQAVAGQQQSLRRGVLSALVP